MINMNKSVKKVVLSAIFFLCVLGLFLGCLSALFAMTGCAREDADPAVLFADRLVASEEYEVVLEETFGGSADEGKDFVALCRSLSEMKAVCSRNGYGGLFHEEIREAASMIMRRRKYCAGLQVRIFRIRRMSCAVFTNPPTRGNFVSKGWMSREAN